MVYTFNRVEEFLKHFNNIEVINLFFLNKLLHILKNNSII